MPRQNAQSQVRIKSSGKPLQTSLVPDSEAIAPLFPLMNLHTVEIVDARETIMTSEVVEMLSTHHQLNEFFVGYGFDDNLAKWLPKYQNLSRLHLGQATVTDQCVDDLMKMPNLKQLTLGPNMTDQTLATLGKHDRIDFLGCQFSQISDAGIANLRSAKSLKSLTLNGRPITVRSLAEINEHTDVQWLSISNCDRLTEEDLEYLLKMRKLRYLAIRLPPGLRERLQFQRPRVKLFP